ncbi:MAG TPA: hypothetical protein VJ757_10605 [Pseudonocardiaceae bacterium]|nr:hypothetical protein [Pseudonocardiaceae bacterium]
MVGALIEQLAARRPDYDGELDTRTVPQRQADALIELCDYRQLISAAATPPPLRLHADPGGARR